ncbi:hypothetical protein HHX47_DHR1002089 [Lentinula edodes]|nr:hypothetical protein HHX47_DHR1002089 [Lentinula edodes]
MSNTETNTAAAEQNIASGNDGATNFKRGDEGSPRGPGKCLMVSCPCVGFEGNVTQPCRRVKCTHPFADHV